MAKAIRIEMTVALNFTGFICFLSFDKVLANLSRMIAAYSIVPQFFWFNPSILFLDFEAVGSIFLKAPSNFV